MKARALLALAISLLGSCGERIAFAAVCTPDLANYTPTPVITWDKVTDDRVASIRLYYRLPPATAYSPLATLPCWPEDDGARSCRGGAFGYPVQRATTLELQTVEICARAVTATGIESTTCSNVLSLCMPQVWHGGAYR